MSLRLPPTGRGMSIRWVAPAGSGKSLGLGQRLCPQDFDAGPLIVLDPLGATVDNFLQALISRSGKQQQRDGKRLRYLDMGGLTGYVTPLPIYQRGRRDSLFQVAEAPLEVWQRSDPALGSAPIMGLNAIRNTGRFVGMALAALGWGITEAESLLSDPKRFEGQLKQAVLDDPKVRPAAEWLLSQMPKPGSNEWRNQTNSFLNKIHALTLDDSTRAIYGGSGGGIDWREVVDDNLAVLVDFRGVATEEHRRFGLLWVFAQILEFARSRPAGAKPVSVMIDELSYFLSSDPNQQNVLADDFEELVSRLARNRSIQLTVTHQRLNQLTKRMADVLMGCGTQIFAGDGSLEAGETWARRFDPYDPELIKKVNVRPSTRSSPGSVTTVEYTMQEQVRLAAQKYIRLPAFTFWGAVSQREGELGENPELFTIEHGNWVNHEKVAEARQLLSERHGRKIEDVLEEIDARIPETVASAPPPRKKKPSLVVVH